MEPKLWSKSEQKINNFGSATLVWRRFYFYQGIYCTLLHLSKEILFSCIAGSVQDSFKILNGILIRPKKSESGSRKPLNPDSSVS